MSRPIEKVELGFDANGPGNWFILDDPTKGQLDNTTYVLNGALFYDVTQYIKSISTNRGKNRELDRYNAGRISVDFDNTNRYFDPTYVGSPFYGQIVPHREIQYSSNGIVQFYGIIDDWDLDYSPSGQSHAQATAFDGFTDLAKQTLVGGTATSQLSGARINAILSDPGVDLSTNLRDIDAGDQMLQADVIAAGENAISYIQLVEASEHGDFFFSKSGKATWRSRQSAVASSSATLLSDDGTGIPYTSMKVIYGSELLYNQAELTRLNGGSVQSNDLASQQTYGVRTLSQDGLIVDTDTSLVNLANYLVTIYAQPEFRFEQVEIMLSSLSESDQNKILGLEIGSVCRIKFTPNKIGSAIDKYAKVIGVSHQVGPVDHRVVLGFQTLDFAFLILDDPAVGLLDYNVLGF